jgi:xylulose-5-phosphate/fructose-6-phosphate phosphoketolase
MIFLQENIYLKRPLIFDDIKPRLLGEHCVNYFINILIYMVLGHWGTCPGLILIYSHLNYLINQLNLDMLLVVGPGHGAPGILASLWLEGSLQKFYPQYSRDSNGLKQLISTFSTTTGLPRSKQI